MILRIVARLFTRRLFTNNLAMYYGAHFQLLSVITDDMNTVKRCFWVVSPNYGGLGPPMAMTTKDYCTSFYQFIYYTLQMYSTYITLVDSSGDAWTFYWGGGLKNNNIDYHK